VQVRAWNPTTEAIGSRVGDRSVELGSAQIATVDL